MTNVAMEKGRGRKKALQGLLMLLLCGALAGCYWIGLRHQQRNTPPTPEVPMTEETFDQSFPYLAVTHADHETEGEGAREIDLSQAGEELLLSEGGVYRLTGKMSGQIRIAAEEQPVRLILENVSLMAKEGPALWVESAGKLILTLADGTENLISDSGDYRKTPDMEACIYSAADLTINGGGTLSVSGLYKDAIRSRNVVKVLDGKIIIRSKRTGIHGTDGIHITGGSLEISSEKYGLRTTKSGLNGRGNLVVAGGDHRIIAGRFAFLVGRGDLYIYNCSVFENSVVSAWDVGGQAHVQSGCVQ